MNGKQDRGRWQFNLSTLLGVLLLCAVVFGLIVNATMDYHVTIRCNALPGDDQKLHDWFQDQPGVRDLVVTREGNSVQAHFSQRLLASSFKIATPNLEDFGYSGVKWIDWRLSGRGFFDGFTSWIMRHWVVWAGLFASGFVGLTVVRRYRSRNAAQGG